MARSPNALDRSAIALVAQEPRVGVQARSSNSALRLANSVARSVPDAQRVLQGIAEEEAEKARAEARRDAIEAQGAELAEAVRSGVIRPTQNPWYVDAYNRESAAIRGQDALSELQVQTSTWDERDDPQAFQQRWREEVAALSEAYDVDPETAAGFSAAEAAISAQVLQQNVSRNAARIEAERVTNLGQLGADALQRLYVERGGRLSPNDVYLALQPAMQQWFATGGDQMGWYAIVQSSVMTVAEATSDPDLPQILRAPELLSGPSQEGALATSRGGEAYSGIEVVEVPPSRPAIEAAEAAGETAPAPRLVVRVPPRQGFAIPLPVEGRLTSGFGPRRRPTRGASTNHQGIDIAAPAGTPIRAQGTGRVTYAQRNGGYGNQVRIDYGNGVEVRIAHMQGFDVQEGDLVSAGQVLGGVGRTGTATGYHAHYEVWVNGQPVDPQTFNGQIGGTEFEQGEAAAAPPEMQTFEGFPEGSSDRPFEVDPESLPLNRYQSGGPSIYSLPGVAQEVEQRSFYIQQRAEQEPLRRARVLQAQRTARGIEGADFLFDRYGSAVITGGVTRDQMIEDLSGQGYSLPEINAALAAIREPLQDSVGVANAQVAARSQNPEEGTYLLDMTVEARTQGWSPGLQTRLEQSVVSGRLTWQEADSIAAQGLSRTRQIESDAERDADRARAEQERSERAATNLQSAGAMRERVGFDVSNLIVTLSGRGIDLSEEQTNSVATAAILEAEAHLSRNPGDYEGAYAAARAVVGRYGARALRATR